MMQGATATADCTPCAAGSYNKNAGATACALCDAGKAQGTEGMLSCGPCVAGSTWSAQGAAVCVKCSAIASCPVGFTRNDCTLVADAVCTMCQPIAHCAYSGGACVVGGRPACACEAGFSMTAGGACAQCGSGNFSTGGGPCVPWTVRGCEAGQHRVPGTPCADASGEPCPLPRPDNAIGGAEGCQWRCAGGFEPNGTAVR